MTKLICFIKGQDFQIGKGKGLVKWGDGTLRSSPSVRIGSDQELSLKLIWFAIAKGAKVDIINDREK